VCGQHHAPAAFTPGKDPVTIVQEVGWASEPVWIGAQNLAPPGFDPRTFQPVASRYSDYASSGGILYICRPAGRPANRQSTENHNTYQLLYIYSIPPDDGLQICPKHIEVDWWNKLRIHSAPSWCLLHMCIEMHGQQNIKLNSIHYLIWQLPVHEPELPVTRGFYFLSIFKNVKNIPCDKILNLNFAPKYIIPMPIIPIHVVG
jgi:hypothetical protein